MIKTNYQALREAAVKATWGDWDSYKPHRGARGYEVRLSGQAIAKHVLKNNAEFIAAFNPKVALALLDEIKHMQDQALDDGCRIAELEEALRDKQALIPDECDTTAQQFESLSNHKHHFINGTCVECLKSE
ncbi:ead/Ea22-like family protein [Salmonella enterica]|uniref:Ead/Ea22-like family protein n=1 Tax=Salmonella phage vB_Se_STGO-35-1 TaxID=2749381 RepID=A0A889INW6_9CAUD|nr:ead/Ea22-like family protein [Salmonella enterica]YP_010054103.1 hypothetical protein KGB48_gp60 [Salmonella phage vB_Se_STGO-35-1]MCO9872083.1 ead/Ea22-like family protein [Salmonella enterica subsp. enterica serovar Reading]MCP0078109.1 ead/Ea22-like family protein [Salmonella enterica subsp. enterica serovar Reading]MCP0094712.1 ead/Ea22-like family protein [Salmonella enterica subsp. enterica serovar Reading]MCP0424793.1 ead/Ea22-like family protein [Salmonella enterica subsp. enterica 